MKSIFNRVKRSGIVLAVSAVFCVNSCLGEVTINLFAQQLANGDGSIMTNGLVLFVVSKTDANFSLPTTTNFVSGDDVIITSWQNIQAAGRATKAIKVQLVNGIDSSDKLALYWFPTLTNNQVFPIPAGTPYGFFNDVDNAYTTNITLGSPWAIPGDGSSVTINFKTTNAPVNGHYYPPSAGYASLLVAGGNTAPVANDDGPFLRAPGLSVKIPITTLLANDTDADTNTLTFTGIAGLSTNGVTLTTNAQYVFYPSNVGNVSDRFSYTISDGQGGASTGLVYIAISTNVFGQALSITNAAGSFIATFAGIPTYNYTVRRANDVGFTVNVTNLVTTNLANGVYLFNWTDGNPPSPTAFYRIYYNP